jgi:hypothetical protein
MKITSSAAGVLVGLVTLSRGSPVFAADLPPWRGPGRDGEMNGLNLPQTWPQP